MIDQDGLDRQNLRLAARFRIGLRQLGLRLRERLEFDSPVTLKLMGFLAILTGAGLFGIGRKREGFGLLCSVHRANCSPWTTDFIERWLKDGARQAALQALYRDHHRALRPTPQTRKFFERPDRLLGPIVMVLKASRPGEKGIIVINYSFVFPLFARLFDVERVADRYHLVLEPSWSGYCVADILCYTLLDAPVFVQAYEPRDGAFLDHLRSNLVPVPVSANWWVDHRLFQPRDAAPSIDVVMIASWADFKRHARFFSAVRELRARRRSLKVVLIGYPAGRSKEDIETLARYHGVSDLIEIREWLPPEEVADTVSRARVNVVWSRREGVNRAIIEGMFAGVPCVIRTGFNYGYRYPYVNEMTGCFATEEDLPDKLEWIMENPSRFSPRDWVMRHMSPQKATEVLGESVRQVALTRGERWSEGPVVKVDRLHDMVYWNQDDRQRFEADYAFLRTTLRKPPSPPSPARVDRLAGDAASSH